MENLEDLGAPGDLVSQLGSRQSDHGDEYGVDDERVVLNQLVRSESGDRVRELLGSGVEVSHQDGADALVDLQAVSSVPITAFLDDPKTQEP